MGLCLQEARVTLRPSTAGSAQACASHPVTRPRLGATHGHPVPQARWLCSSSTAKAANPGSAGHPAAHCPPSQPCRAGTSSLQSCPREQQCKTNLQTQQTYFFDSLNIKKKKKPTNVSSKQSPLPTALRVRTPSVAGGGHGSLSPLRPCLSSGAPAGLAPGV